MSTVLETIDRQLEELREEERLLRAAREALVTPPQPRRRSAPSTQRPRRQPTHRPWRDIYKQAEKTAARKRAHHGASQTAAVRSAKGAAATGRATEKTTNPRQEEALKVISTSPGISSADLSRALGLKSYRGYEISKALVRRGRITGDNKGWRLA